MLSSQFTEPSFLKSQIQQTRWKTEMGSGSRLALLVQHSFRRRINTAHATPATHLDQQETLSSSAGHGSFESDLAERLKQLQLQGVGGSAHLNWLLDACACTLSTHSSLSSLLSSFPTANAQSHRADEVVSLLDVCTSLKQVADDADRQLCRLQRALQSAEQALRAPCIRVQAAAHRLSAACQHLDAVGSPKDQCQAQAALLLAAKRVEAATPAGSDPLDHALDGTLLISLLVLASAISSFRAPSRFGAARSTCKLVDRYCSKISSRAAPAVCAWVAPLRQLQRDLRQDEMGAVFVELQALRASAASLMASITLDSINVEAVRQGLDSLQKRSQEAQSCLCMLRSHLASLFQALVALRLTLLLH